MGSKQGNKITFSARGQINSLNLPKMSFCEVSTETQEAIREILLSEDLLGNLEKVRSFLDQYGSDYQPETLKLNFTEASEGFYGECVKDGVVEVCLPDFALTTKGYISQRVVSPEISRELFYKGGVYVTTFHECCHALFSTRPSSRLAGVLSELNQDQINLFDEGVVYALADYFAPEVKGFGKLVSRPDQVKDDKVKERMLLGKKFYPVIKSYLDTDVLLGPTQVNELKSLMLEK